MRAQAKVGDWRPAVTSFSENWIKEGLKDRAITRDLTYGIEIPKEAGTFPDKRIYVWFDAVIGYLSAAIEASKNGGPPWEDFWRAKNGARHVYFLGKDNIPFHSIIFPSMLLAYNAKKPDDEKLAMPFDIVANQFLQFSGAKFSKSRGNAFYVLDLLKTFDVDAVRYYLVSNLPEKNDCDWTWHDFIAKVNEEFLATVGNYFNRVLAFIDKNFGGKAPEALAPGIAVPDELAARDAAFRASTEAFIAEAARELDAREFKKAFRALINLAQGGNKAIDELAPWSLVKRGEEGKALGGQMLLTHLSVIKSMAIVFTPFLPHLCERLWAQLGETSTNPKALSEKAGTASVWPERLATFTPGQRFGKIEPLVRKLDRDEVLKEFTDTASEGKLAVNDKDATAGAAEKTAKKESAPKAKAEAAAPGIIGIEDFTKVDLRIGLVTKVEDHPKGDKLFVLEVDLGTEKRQICAGLRGIFTPEELLGKHVTIVANLAPRVLRGVESNGMLLAVTDGDKKALLTSSVAVSPGSKIG